MIDFLDTVIHWRPILCTAASAALAVGLAQVLSWFDGLPGIVLGCLGLIPGVIWQARADGRR